MTSDKERSEVAKSLRSVAKVAKRREGNGIPDLCAAWMALSTAITGRIAFCNTSDAFNALADLIEPEHKLTGLQYDECCIDELTTLTTRKAYVVSVFDGELPGAYKIPMWLYSSREAAEKKASEYTKKKYRLAWVSEVEVIA